MGVDTVTCMAICGAGTTVLLTLGMKPESNPPSSLSQGVVKADCVAVWLADSNWKMTVSPMAASIVFGVYTSPAEPPTTTVCVACDPALEENDWRELIVLVAEFPPLLTQMTMTSVTLCPLGRLMSRL